MSKIKPVFRCEESFKSVFNKSTCLLTISVGQEVHEGEKFLTTVMLVNESFGQCVMLIDDTLQRHTMAIEVDEETGDALFVDSRQAGDTWLARNQAAYSCINIPCKIIRWDEWLNHPNYLQVRAMLEKTYQLDADYRASFEQTIDQFLGRYSRRHQDKNYATDGRVRRLCLEYLFEECSAMCLWPELGCQFEVYPSHRNAAMNETHHRFILPNHPSLLHAVRVKFKNK